MWAARAKMSWLMARAVIAGITPIDFTMGDIQITADGALVESLVLNAQRDRFP